MSLLSRLRHPQTTVRWRLTLLYGGLFLICGAGLLAITYALVAHATSLPRAAQFTTVGAGRPSGNLPNLNVGSQVRAKGPPSATAFPQSVRSLFGSKSGRKAVDFVVRTEQVADLHHLEVESAIALAIMAIISALLGWMVAGRVLRPLRTMTAAAQEISEANLHRRLGLPGPRDELRRLADTIDGLLARLEAAFDAQRRFVANASHELRTPLTAARALLEMVLTDRHATVETFRETCQQVLKENEYQEELIEALLTLAQGQRGLDRHEHVDLGETVHQVADAHELDALAAGVSLAVSASSVIVDGDPRLIERLVSNLVENGIRHNVADGRIEVSVRDDRGTGLLEVTNTGPVIPPGEVGRLLQPFQRRSRERTGHRDGLGLGLSIVAAVAEAHGAELEVRPRQDGGLTVLVRFPLQLVLEHLPERVSRERVNELQPAGTLEGGETLGGELE